MTAIQAIETRYKSCRFRSRLEARWAVFFDTLGVPWEYEKEGFQLASGVRFLPDFWLPHLRLWVEIKAALTWVQKPSPWHRSGQLAASPELQLAEAFCREQEWPVAIVAGSPSRERIWFWCWDCTDSSGGEYSEDDCQWVWSNAILTLDVHPGRSDRVFIADNLCGETLPQFAYPMECGSDRLPIERAYAAARSARFEHGESPR